MSSYLMHYSVLYELNTLDACWIVVDVGVKIGGSRVGGPELWILDQWGTRDEEHGVYPGSGPLEEVKPYVLL